MTPTMNSNSKPAATWRLFIEERKAENSGDRRVEARGTREGATLCGGRCRTTAARRGLSIFAGSRGDIQLYRIPLVSNIPYLYLNIAAMSKEWENTQSGGALSYLPRRVMVGCWGRGRALPVQVWVYSVQDATQEERQNFDTVLL